MALAVLHEAVVAVNESWLSGAVSRYGRIRPDEIPYLIDQTASWYQQLMLCRLRSGRGSDSFV